MLLVAAIVLASLLASPAAAQAPQPCAPGAAPAATIRGFDIEDGGGTLTATHTIGLEARDRDGPIQNVTFSLPPGVEARGTESDPAFSFDRPAPIPVTATWSHYVESDGSTCTASAQGTLQLQPTKPLSFLGLRPGSSRSEAFQSLIRAGKNADRRPVELRLRGVRRARLPGRRARVQTVTLPLRRGDPGLSRARQRRLRAGGWRFVIGYVDEHQILIGASLLENCRGRRGCSRGFGFSIDLVQARQRVGRIRVSGRCGYLGCRWRAF
jgi:hypothetical protein